jgi:hypothetical protein
MPTGNLLAHAVEVYEALEEVAWEGNRYRGRLDYAPKWQTSLAALDEEAAVEIRLRGQTVTLNQLIAADPVGESLAVAVTPPHQSNAYFARDLTTLLSVPSFRYSPPSSFYLAEQRSRYPGGTESPTSEYIQAISLVELLREVADHEEPRAGELWLIFLSPIGKVDFPVDYGVADLTPLEGLDNTRATVQEQPHATVKRGIFRSTVTDLTANIPTRARFGVLLRQFPELVKRFGDNLELYLSEFSFETERERLETLVREYMLKVNSAVGDIHAKLIAIPASAVLVAGQMKAPESAPDVVLNIVLVFGAVVFAILMFAITKNQRHSLEAVRNEYTQRRSRLEAEMPSLEAALKTAFERLDARYAHQKLLLQRINLSIWVGLGVSVLVFILYFFLPTAPQIPEAFFRFVSQ